MLDFIFGAVIGLCLFWLTLYAIISIFRFFNSPPRCERGEKCGCKTATQGCSSYRLCEDKPERYYD